MPRGELVFLLIAIGCSPSTGSSDADGGTPIDASEDGRRGPLDAGGPVDGPRLLSETGLYSNFAARTIAPGIIPFTPRYPLWSDGSEKQRYLYLPPGTKIDTTSMDDWSFPIGTKVWKEFTVDGKRVETRLLWKQAVGIEGWWMAAYVWRADGTDADAMPDGVPNALGTSHDVPSHDDCRNCHQDMSDVLAGVGAVQLSSPSGKGMLSELAASGWLTAPPAGEYQPPGAAPVQAALGYLHGNCGNCHNGRGRTLAQQTPLRLNMRVTDTTAEQTNAMTTTIGKKVKHVIAPDIDQIITPGNPDRSVLWLRMVTRDPKAPVGESVMPPTSTKVVDPAATVVRDWIANLPPQ